VTVNGAVPLYASYAAVEPAFRTQMLSWCCPTSPAPDVHVNVPSVL
jgi:hypothetical protein